LAINITNISWTKEELQKEWENISAINITDIRLEKK
jgi:hypothetical protein